MSGAMPVLGEERTLRATGSPTLAGDWSLVLASAGIAHKVLQGAGAFAIVVGAHDVAPASAALAAFVAESVPVVVPPAPDLGPSVLGVVSAALLLAMFVVAGPRDGGTSSAWFDVGSASAEKILAGQWWRAFTALTLHADVLHVVGNVVACLIFVSAVGRWLGAGLGATLVVGAAAAANVLDAVRHRVAFTSVGASTATFAALGILAGLQVVRSWRVRGRRGYAWLPLGAAFGLYAMLGAGGRDMFGNLTNVDIWAHLFGLAVGAVAGAGLAASRVRTPGRLGQTLLTLAVSAVMIGAWVVAFRVAGRAPS